MINVRVTEHTIPYVRGSSVLISVSLSFSGPSNYIFFRYKTQLLLNSEHSTGGFCDDPSGVLIPSSIGIASYTTQNLAIWSRLYGVEYFCIPSRLYRAEHFYYSKQVMRNRIFPANIYLFKVNNRNSRKRCEICSKLLIKTIERRQ